MALDGLTLQFIRKEIADAAVGCRIEKVHQPSREELVLVLRGRNGSHKLLLSAGANSPKIHFTQFPPENPAKPPMLCMLLRKQLTSALLTNVRQEGLERALFLEAPILVDQIFDIIKELHKAGTTILLVEQNARKALQIADRAYVLETGSITLSGPGAELAQSDEVRKAYLGG